MTETWPQCASGMLFSDAMKLVLFKNTPSGKMCTLHFALPKTAPTNRDCRNVAHEDDEVDGHRLVAVIGRSLALRIA